MKLRQRWLFGVIMIVPFLWITVVFWAAQKGRYLPDTQGVGGRGERGQPDGHPPKINRKISAADYSSAQSDEGEETSDEEREIMRKKGLPYDSTLFFASSRKRIRIPYVKVENRSKFEALFRDFPSFNKVPELQASDHLLRDREP